MTRVAVVGAGGHMGRTIADGVAAQDDLELVALVDRSSAGEVVAGVTVVVDRDALRDTGAEVAVDFTSPGSVADNVAWYLSNGIHAVVGTTGWTDEDIERFRDLAEQHAVNAIIAPNFAIGAVLMMHLASIAARHMPHLEIVEVHHEGKTDAPSGTALLTADRIAAARSEVPDEVASHGLPEARGAQRAGVRVHSVRLPGVVSRQEILFGSTGQMLSIRHDSIDRSSFLPGVLLAIRTVAQRPGVTVGLDALLDL